MNTCTIKNNDKMYRVKGSEIIHDLSDLSLGDVYNSVLSKSIDSVNYYWLGRQDYNESWSLQKIPRMMWTNYWKMRMYIVDLVR